MPEPTLTANFAIPRQLPGQGSRDRLNASFDRTDALFAYFSNALAGLGTQVSQIRVHAPIVATAGQTLFVTQEPYEPGVGALIVYSGGVLCSIGLHWTEVSATAIQFTSGRELGEVIQVIEIQYGATVIPPPPVAGVGTELTEVPVGPITSTNGFDGNAIFALSRDIAIGTTPTVVISGFLTMPPGTYTWATNLITFTSGNNPVPGETLTVKYTPAP